MSVEYLDLEDLLQLCADLGELVVRDIGLLDAAAQRPRTSLYGQDAYPSLHEKAAVLLESLARNHALIDGNKRIAWLSTVVFFELNGVIVDAPDDDAYGLIMAVATGTVDHVAAAKSLAAWTSARSS